MRSSWPLPSHELERRERPLATAATLIFHCANELCPASHDAARSALALGYGNTFLMPHGFIGWEESGAFVLRYRCGESTSNFSKPLR